MSWSIKHQGSPAEIVAKLDEYGAQLTGQSKAEFADAAPALKALVEQNRNMRPGGDQPTLHLAACGSGSTENGVEVQRSCGLTLRIA